MKRSLSLALVLALTGSAASQSSHVVQRVTVDPADADTAGLARIEEVRVPGPAPELEAGPGFPQMPGWPKTLMVQGQLNFTPLRGVAFADVDQDGPLEIILSNTDEGVHVWDFAGNYKPGFPASVIQLPQYAPSVADLEGDGDMEIVQFTRGVTNGGRFYILDHLGATVPGFPVSVNNNNLAGSPTLFDLDDDGVLEILVPERASPIGRLHVFEPDGSEWTTGNWPVDLDHVPTGSPAVADLEGDGQVEIVYLSFDSLYAFETDGSLLSGFPVTIASENFSNGSPALGDMDGDGDLEIATSTLNNPKYHVFHHDGTPLAGWPRSIPNRSQAAPTLVDLDGDGDLELLGGHNGGIGIPSVQLFAWHHDGSNVTGFPFVSFEGGIGGGSAGPYNVCDLDGDGQLEIFVDRNVQSNNMGYLWGLDATGNVLPGFPIRTEGFTYFGGATLGDVDADGDLELGVVTQVSGVIRVYLYDLPDPHDPADVPWEAYHGQNRRGGLVGGGEHLVAKGDWAVGGSTSLHLRGAPGDLATYAFSFLNTRISFPAGWWYLGTPFRRIRNGVTIPASGTFRLDLPVPNLVGTSLFFQGASIGANGVELTNLVTRIVH